jgi:hypothetical protein
MTYYEINTSKSIELLREQFRIMEKRRRYLLHQDTMTALFEERGRINEYPFSEEIKSILMSLIGYCIDLQPVWAKMNEEYDEIEGDFKTVSDALDFCSNAYNFLILISIYKNSEGYEEDN